MLSRAHAPNMNKRVSQPQQVMTLHSVIPESFLKPEQGPDASGLRMEQPCPVA